MNYLRRLFIDKSNPNKTVFISYRRSTSQALALLVYKELVKRDFDVFKDTETLAAGQFERIILNQIAARMHFIIILEPGSLDRCSEPGDWLRLEIEYAIDNRRNIIPILVDDFTFLKAESDLTGKLQSLSSYNALPLHHNYFDEGLDRLDKRFLKLPKHVPDIKPTPVRDRRIVNEKIAQSNTEPIPTQSEIASERHFAKGIAKLDEKDWDGAIEEFTNAINIFPNYTKAFYNRGVAYYEKNAIDNARADYDRAIQIDPHYAKPHLNRGVIRYNEKDFEGAIHDYGKAIDLNPKYEKAYHNRGNARVKIKDVAGAIRDYEEYLNLSDNRLDEIERQDIQKLIDELRHPNKNNIRVKPSSNLLTGGFRSVKESLPLPEPVHDAATRPVTNESLPLPEPVHDAATRPVPNESLLMPGEHAYLDFGQSTDKGMIRTNNQDAILSLVLINRNIFEQPNIGLFAVADGMGGHHDGELASAITTQVLTASLIDTIFKPILEDDNVEERQTIVEALVDSARQANTRILKEVAEGGTTLTTAAIVGNLAYIIHVGDSRAYLIVQNEIEQLTRDHSLVQRLFELNQLTREEMKDHPQSNVLYRALGQSEALEVEILVRPLPQGSQLLLCSDGLWRVVEDTGILEIIQESDTPQQACDKLVAQANANGGTDNISVVLVKI